VYVVVSGRLDPRKRAWHDQVPIKYDIELRSGFGSGTAVGAAV
jgi:hypothetical protein